MLLRSPLRALATSAAAAAVLAVGVMAVSPAQAAGSGTLDISPKTGTDESGIDFATSGACPDTASYVIVTVKGTGFPAEGQNVVGNAPIETYSSTADGGMFIPLSSTMRDYANIAGFSTLKGRYDFTVICRTAFDETSLGDFTGAVWFTSNTAYTTTNPDGPDPSGSPDPSPSPSATDDPDSSPSPSDPTPSDSVDPSDDPSGSPEPSDDPEPSDSGDPSDPSDPAGGTSGGSTDGGTTGGSADGGATGGSSGSAGTGGGGSGVLANTGAQAGIFGAGSLALIAAGTAAVRWARRRDLLTFGNGAKL
ncbi:hypothetical protein [Streptomyces paludis]|uniref:LPXTG cell wall anchor domain-containing protein n=1 Tax=Streptomyces paludis TaxID=2282738 RepID=A0A345HM22_9ACTN|nr:hypothetical protein [Streptomyces paludis]AXG77746.1 hypothetical protein DVK44_08595 [Streptomyces paludis]